MGVMVPLTAYLTRRFSTREIVLVSMVVFTIGSLFAWLGPTFLMVLIGRLLEAVGTGVMWPVLQITVFSIYPLSRRGFARVRLAGDERGSGDRPDAWRCADGLERLAFNFPHVDHYRRNFAASCLFWIA